MPRFTANENAPIRARGPNEDSGRIVVVGVVVVNMRGLVRVQIGQIGSVSLACVHDQQARLTGRLQDLLAGAHSFLELGHVVPEFGPEATRF